MGAPLEMTLTHEAWYADTVRRTAAQQGNGTGREVHLQSGADGAAYCTFTEHALGQRPALRLEVWSDGWLILAEQRSLFARIAARLEPGSTLEDVRDLCLEYGAVDVTPRARPSTTNPKD